MRAIENEFVRRFVVPAVASTALYWILVSIAYRNDYYMYVLTMCAINVIGATSLNLINGFTGQFSLGHAGFMAVGAYVAGSLTKFGHWPFVGALLAGMAGAAVAGFLVGLPTLRLRGDYLAIATLGFGEIIRMLIINSDKLGLKFLEGPRGVPGIKRYSTFGWAFFFAVVTVWILANYIWSTHGRACGAVKEDEVAAEAMGVGTTTYKVMSFTIGASFAGLAGGLHAHLLQLLHPASYDFLKSCDFLVMIVVGGMGNLTGSVLGALFVTLITEALRKLLELRMLAYAVGLICVMLFRPEGLFGTREFSLGALRFLAPRRPVSQVGGDKSGAT
ncbi:MAG TPA: branched-chain amino acid ABC transporter permease [Firmicutes bacterium]|nr:branched-chain amino acid ABC transporter permease [Bacillota bacterium]